MDLELIKALGDTEVQMIRLPVVRQQLVDRRLTVLLLLLLDILVKRQTHQDAELILEIN